MRPVRKQLRRASIGLEAGVALTRATLALRRVPEDQVASLLGTPSPPTPDPPAGPGPEARRVGRAVIRAAGLLPWHPTCLPQALAAQRMLRRRGIAHEGHLGVTKAEPFEAHAWVTVRGTPVVGGPIHHATRLASFR